MGLLDTYLDPETLATMKTLNQPDEATKQAAQRNALMQAGFAMMMNNGQGATRGQSLMQSLGAGGMSGMGAYQGTIDAAQKDQQQSLQMGMGLAKMKKDAEQQQKMQDYIDKLGTESGGNAPYNTNAVKADIVFNGGKNAGTIIASSSDPKLQYVASDGYTPAHFVDLKTGRKYAPGEFGAPTPGAAPSAVAPQQEAPVVPTKPAVDPRAPWRDMPPKQADEFRQKVYEQENAKLKDLREQIAKGDGIAGDLARFGELNRETATGSFLDRAGLPSISPNKREMESIVARLAPNVRPAGSGSTSDKDMGLYLSGLPGVGQEGPTNQKIREQFSTNLATSKAKLAFSEDYLAQNGHLNGVEQAWQNRNAKPSDSPMPETVKYPASAGTKDGAKVPDGAQGRVALLSEELKQEQSRLTAARSSGDLKGISEANRNIELLNKELGGMSKKPAQAKSAKTPVATGMYGGKKVVKYSDGSVEYAN